MVRKDEGVWTLCISLMCCSIVAASHFRGGTISWKGTGNGNEVQFKFKMGWTFGRGPGCTSALIGQFVSGMSRTTGWTCISGCPNKTFLASVNYYCTAASATQGWEQGENSFTYTFPSQGPFLIQFTGGDWMSLSYSNSTSGDWNLTTVVDLRPRSDTGHPNQSPVAASKPLYNVKYGCEKVIRLPVLDADGDRIRCRWAVGYECAGACNAMPNTKLDQNTCTLTVKATHTSNGWFAVAIVVEDLPRTTIRRGGKTFSTHDVISSTPLQFIVHTPTIPTATCAGKPVFVPPTPPENKQITIAAGDTLRTKFYASSRGSSVMSFALTAPPGVSQSAVYAVVGRSGVYAIDVTWTPTAANKGAQALCAEATDAYGMSSESRCLTIVVRDIDPCASGPCQNRGTCTKTGYSNQFTCSCRPGFAGTLCEIDINECASAPCQNSATCIDHVNRFDCRCRAGFTGTLCQIDINECASAPCQNSATCIDHVNRFDCRCRAGFTGTLCQIDIDECASAPCHNGATCIDHVNRFECSCRAGFTGTLCEIDIDECASAPCQNGATCIDHVNRFECSCRAGFTGTLCEIDIDECASAPCHNGATCIDHVNRFECSCRAGFTGTLCEIDIDECASAPCQNNATCIDQVNQFFCGCRDGFTGTLCQTDIDDCALSPCLNGGTCTDKVAGFVCHCEPNFTGELCQTGMDHCASLPCLNGGQCYSNVTGYFCDCVSPWEGQNCGFRKVLSQNMQTYSHSEYSNCDCMEERHADEACDNYKTSRGIGFGFLGMFLGLLTVIGLYAVSATFLQPGQGNSPATRALEGLRTKSVVSPSPDSVNTGQVRRTNSWHPIRRDGTSQLRVSIDEYKGGAEANGETELEETGSQGNDTEREQKDRAGSMSPVGPTSPMKQRHEGVWHNGPAKPVFRVSLLCK